MPKRLLHVLTFASAVVCAGSFLLVVRSFFRVDVVEAITNGYPSAFAGVATVNGQFCLASSPAIPLDQSYQWNYEVERAATIRPRLDEYWSNMWGVRWVGIGCGTSPYRILVLPLWIVPILTAIPPARWWRLHRLRTRGFAVLEAPAEQPAP
jgi:hypothetical protein